MVSDHVRLHQIVRHFQGRILSGEMKPGDPLPSVRELSDQLGVNHNTIQKAYKELDYHGLTTSVPGKGSFLREDAMHQQIEYLDENVVPIFKNMLRGIRHAGATKEQTLDFVQELLDEMEEPDELMSKTAS